MNERLRLLRKKLELNQEEFGKRIGIGKTSVSKLESGENNPSEQTVILICREFNVNEEWLRSGKGEMFEQLTDQQKIMKYAGLLLKDTDSVVASAIKTFLVTYGQLDDTSKAVLNKIVLQYIENWKGGQ